MTEALRVHAPMTSDDQWAVTLSHPKPCRSGCLPSLLITLCTPPLFSMVSVSTGCQLVTGSPRLLSLSTTLRKLLQAIDPAALLGAAATCHPACDFILKYLCGGIRGAAVPALEKLMKAARRPDADAGAGQAGAARAALLAREQVSTLVAWGLVPALIALSSRLLAAVAATHRWAPSSVGIPTQVDVLRTCLTVFNACGGAALGCGDAARPGVRACYILLAASGMPALLLESSKLALQLHDQRKKQQQPAPRGSSANPATACGGSHKEGLLEACMHNAALHMSDLAGLLTDCWKVPNEAAFARQLLSDPSTLEGLQRLPRTSLACGGKISEPVALALVDAAAQLAAAVRASAQSPLVRAPNGCGGMAGNRLAASAGYDVAMLRLEEGLRRGAGCGYPKCACFEGR